MATALTGGSGAPGDSVREAPTMTPQRVRGDLMGESLTFGAAAPAFGMARIPCVRQLCRQRTTFCSATSPSLSGIALSRAATLFKSAARSAARASACADAALGGAGGTGGWRKGEAVRSGARDAIISVQSVFCQAEALPAPLHPLRAASAPLTSCPRSDHKKRGKFKYTKVRYISILRELNMQYYTVFICRYGITPVKYEFTIHT